MCAGIMKLSNALIYGEKLRCGSQDVENAKLKLSNRGSMPSWLKEVMFVNILGSSVHRKDKKA